MLIYIIFVSSSIPFNKHTLTFLSIKFYLYAINHFIKGILKSEYLQSHSMLFKWKKKTGRKRIFSRAKAATIGKMVPWK